MLKLEYSEETTEVNNTATDAPAPCVTQPTATKILTTVKPLI